MDDIDPMPILCLGCLVPKTYNVNRYTYWNFMDDIGPMPILCLGCLVPKTYNV